VHSIIFVVRMFDVIDGDTKFGLFSLSIPLSKECVFTKNVFSLDVPFKTSVLP
jgi:hypothetical protein